jgi:glycosyltransferase involved in cell wall biosynthesis
MARRHVLVLAYHFPPFGGGGVPRTVGFVKHLGEHGWDVTVLAGPAEHSDQPDVMVDETLLEEVPESVTVLRAAGPEPGPSSQRRNRLDRWLGVRLSRPWSRWWIENATEIAASAKDVDLVYASMSPYESAWVARDAASRLGVPWVADLRDPWALDEMQVFPTGLHRALELRRMRSLLRTAAHVVVNTREAAVELADAFPELESRLTPITNGYEPADFAAPAPALDPDLFRIVFTGGAWNLHIGTSHRSQRMIRRVLGSGIKGVDLLPRSAMFLVEATERLLARRPELRGAIEVEIAGSGTPADTRELESFGGVNHGYLSHVDSVRLVRSADALFLGMQGLADGKRANSVPGKAYEYIASGRPIIAAVPPGDARDLLSSLENVIVCPPTDVAAIEAAIERLVDHKRQHGPEPTRTEIPPGLDRAALTRSLVQVLDAVVGGSAPEPEMAASSAGSGPDGGRAPEAP